MTDRLPETVPLALLVCLPGAIFVAGIDIAVVPPSVLDAVLSYKSSNWLWLWLWLLHQGCAF